jgi:hypothetical protein
MIFKRNWIQGKSYVFEPANGQEYTMKDGKLRWRCLQCNSFHEFPLG